MRLTPQLADDDDAASRQAFDEEHEGQSGPFTYACFLRAVRLWRDRRSGGHSGAAAVEELSTSAALSALARMCGPGPAMSGPGGITGGASFANMQYGPLVEREAWKEQILERLTAMPEATAPRLRLPPDSSCAALLERRYQPLFMDTRYVLLLACD